MIAEHPNTVEARRLREQEIEHVMRCLYRDPRWVGDIPVSVYLRRIHYMDTPRYKRVVSSWLRGARVDGEMLVSELSVAERDRLVWQLLRWLRGERRAA